MATIMEPETQEQAGAARPQAWWGSAPVASPGGRRRTVFLISGVVLLGLVGLGARRWWFNLSHVSTDNAQVDGHIIPILPKVGGFVALVRTDDNRRVQAGDTLVVLDDRDYRVRLAQAEADLAVALAGVSNKARVGQAEAQVAQAEANAKKARAGRDRGRDGGWARGLHGGRVSRGAFPRPRGERLAGDGRAVLAAAARQCDREFHQGRAAGAGAHPTRQCRSCPSVAARDERGRHHPDQVGTRGHGYSAAAGAGERRRRPLQEPLHHRR